MVGGEQQGPAARQVLAPDAPHAEVDEKERLQHRSDGPVEQRVDAALEDASAKRVDALAVYATVLDKACVDLRRGSHHQSLHRPRAPRYSRRGRRPGARNPRAICRTGGVG